MKAANLASAAIGHGFAQGHTYRDANPNAGGMLDTWLQMSRARNLPELLKRCDAIGVTARQWRYRPAVPEHIADGRTG